MSGYKLRVAARIRGVPDRNACASEIDVFIVVSVTTRFNELSFGSGK